MSQLKRNKGLVFSAVSYGPGVKGSVKRQVCARIIFILHCNKTVACAINFICKSLFSCKKTSMRYSKYLFVTTTKPWPAPTISQFKCTCVVQISGETEILARKDIRRDCKVYKVLLCICNGYWI
jgi:hypothetical protein